MNVNPKPIERTATPMMALVDHTTGVEQKFYRCDECKALMLGAKDALDHLHWHDRLLHVPGA